MNTKGHESGPPGLGSFFISGIQNLQRGVCQALSTEFKFGSLDGRFRP